MRVLLCTHGLPPESVGGVEQHVDGLARALVAMGHDVHVFARSSGAGRAQGESFVARAGNPTVTHAVYRWEGLRGLASIYDCEPMATVLRDFLRARAAAGERFDVAHVHHLTGLSTMAVEVLAEAGLPVVLTLHDYWLVCPRGQMWSAREQTCTTVAPDRCGECLSMTFRHWVSPESGPAVAAALHARALATILRADALVVPSPRAIPPYAALGVPPSRFTVVENGVDTEALRAVPPPACAPGPLRLCYLGTVMPSKGLHVLLDAVQRQDPGTVRLSIHGNVVSYHGDDTYPLRCFARLRPGDDVHYHGPYAPADLPAILASADVLCAPALWHETFGLTVREALAAGRPVLVSRVGGLQDAVADGDAGLVLEPGDRAAWAAAIRALAADRARVAAMAARTRGRARGFEAMARDLLAVYTRAGAGRAGRPGAPAAGAPLPQGRPGQGDLGRA